MFTKGFGDFFISVGINDIKENQMQELSYERKQYVDYHVPSVGTISDPIIDFDVKYDTLKKYGVGMVGDVMFCKDDSGYWDTSRKDSIRLREVVILGIREGTVVRYNSRNPIDFKKCGIPYEVLSSIREDFFFRMKYTKFDLVKTKSNGYTYSHYYVLY
ncbi:hypothetical protein [Prevotella sp. OH937_COT-195]|uniref:hypothetical protein n=1 Tax=Prevotella sp. OH937_COT-195 TaxID=2491051 RepID=UPI000F6539E4|nr:hypothetical protein [Prevotella sp. OH937_COT-195]RRC96909.1 hypothetical protein EII32_10870 [Prevotella sp. OH937_COT-195]